MARHVGRLVVHGPGEARQGFRERASGVQVVGQRLDLLADLRWGMSGGGGDGLFQTGSGSEDIAEAFDRGDRQAGT
ncbi:MAG TPA: hypothetical protein VFU12_14110 [Glycomyces sp.]|nr:hypothetical protein [Glycomyces sp.]